MSIDHPNYVPPPAPFPLPLTPLSGITPFTYRDGYTFLHALETLRQRLNVILDGYTVQNEAIEDFRSYLNVFLDDLMGKLVGYTIEIGDETYRASMMDGSVFEAYTIAGTDTALNELEGVVNAKVENLTDHVQTAVTDLTTLINNAIDGIQQEMVQLETTLGDQFTTFQNDVNSTMSDYQTAITQQVNSLTQNDFFIVDDENTERALKLGIGRQYHEYNTTDVFDSYAEMGMHLIGQASTDTEGIPGYNQGELFLREDGNISTWLRLIGNRVLINRRLEIDSGATSRVSIRGGSGTSEVATIGFHNRSNRMTLTSESHSAPNLLTTHGVALTVNNSNDTPNPLMVESRHLGQSVISTRISHVVSTGVAMFRSYYAGQEVGRITFDQNNDGVLRLQSTNIQLAGEVDVINDIFVRSPNGTRYNIRVNNAGEVIAVAR